MAGDEPNPLVVALAKKLIPPAAVPSTTAGLREPAPEKSAQDVADEFAGERTPELVTYAGYLGGLVTARDEQWRVLYLDMKLLTWLLIEERCIVSSFRDKDGPFGTRDVIWVDAGANVSQGEGPVGESEVQARFLRGRFTSAADFTASLSGGTFSAPTGALCEAMTPTCCGRRTK